MKRTLQVAMALILMLSSLSVLAEPLVIADPINVIELMEHEGLQALYFAAELNIDNGNPYTRDHGERGMFGKLVFATDKDLPDYLDRADAIFAEVKRLLIGPLEGHGTTELEFCEVGRGIKLDLQTGRWVKSKGGQAIRIIHQTEYMGGNRRAYILLDCLSIWRKAN